MARPSGDPEAQRAALAMLARGDASPAEIAELAGVSRQLVAAWARSAGVQWRQTRLRVLTKNWRKAFRRRPGRVRRRQAGKPG